jgi:predicted oxidoreductase
MVKGAEVASAEIINRCASGYMFSLNPAPLSRNPLSVEELAKKKNASMAQISIAWLLQQDPVAAPIVGTTSLENLYDIIG